MPSQTGATGPPPSSKDMDPFPDNFAPVFIRNQFLTTIPTPTKQQFGDLGGKCAIVTGSNTGLGLEASRQLLSLGLSRLIMGVRNLDSGATAAKQLREANPSASVDVWHLDMESYDSVRAFAARCDADLDRIDMVILNAGLSPLDFAVVPTTGHERAVQVNHISTALLALLLVPVLRAKSAGRSSPPPHLTLVNSAMAQLCSFPNRDARPLLPSFDDVTVYPWNGSERYGASKLLSQLFVARLTELVGPDDVIINMVDPGLTKGTGLSRDVRGPLWLVMKMFVASAGRPVSKGASTYVDAVVKQGKGSHGSFLMNCHNAP